MSNNRAIWVIKVLNESASIELPQEYQQWLYDNVESKSIVVCVEDCILKNLDLTDKYKDRDEKIVYVQNLKEFTSKEDINMDRPLLVLLPITLAFKFPGYSVFWYEPSIKNKSTSKTTTIYGIRTTDDEMSNSSIKAYCATYDIALREAKKYNDWWSEKPATERNIVPIEVITE